MQVILKTKSIQNEHYQDLLSCLSTSTLNLYVLIFNRGQHTNLPCDKSKAPSRRDSFYKSLRQLESLGLISITLEDKGQ